MYLYMGLLAVIPGIIYFTFFIQISKKPYFIVLYEIRLSCEKNTGFQPIP